MLDAVDSCLHRHLGIDRLGIRRHAQAEKMGLLDRRLDLVRGKVAGQLDQIRAPLELKPHRGAPGIRSRGLDELRIRPGRRGVHGEGLRTVSADSHDQLTGGEDPRTRNFAGIDLVLQDERRDPVGADVPNTGDPALDEVAQPLGPAQRRVGLAVLPEHLGHALPLHVGQVRVQVDQAGHDRLVAGIDDLGVLGGRKLGFRAGDPGNVTADDEDRGRARGSTRAIEQARVPDDNRACRLCKPLRHGEPAQIVAGLGGAVIPAGAVDRLVLRLGDSRQDRRRQGKGEERCDPSHRISPARFRGIRHQWGLASVGKA